MNDASSLPPTALPRVGFNEIPARAHPLLDELRGQFDFGVHRWQVGAYALLVAAVACSDRLLDELAELPQQHPRVRDERMPYWADIWPSSRALAEWIARRPDDLTGQHVLEIGCGQGLPGVVAGLRGAAVTLSDYEKAALAFAQLNWQLNLDTPASTLCLDWRNPPEATFDLLLAADVAYEARSFEPLLGTFQQCLRPGGCVWLAEPQRPVAVDFFRLLRANGFEIETDTTEVSAPGSRGCIDLHEIRRA